MSVTSQPLAFRPRISASRRRGELRRVSRPRLTRLPGMALQVGAEGAAELFHVGVEQFHVGNAADIVFSKNGWFEHVSFVLNIPWR